MKTVMMAILLTCVNAYAGDVFLSEQFDDISQWDPLTFDKIEKHSKYRIEKDTTNSVPGATNNVLVAETDASASGLIYTNTFNVTNHPLVKWRWKVDNVYEKGDASSKKGDDYPIRVYVIFKYDPKEAGFGLKTKYGLAKKVNGEYPPHSSLNYIWASREHKKDVVNSPYTSRSKMIPLQAGDDNVGKWVEEQVDIVADYEKAFGKKPPREASIAIMSDSDNTGEKATAYIDYMEVYRAESPPEEKK